MPGLLNGNGYAVDAYPTKFVITGYGLRIGRRGHRVVAKSPGMRGGFNGDKGVYGIFSHGLLSP
ncbi:MAG: hypothetical protein M0Q44_01545 [Methylobacter sp.]|nr:hypothetical protein [Methylobacter sp.]